MKNFLSYAVIFVIAGLLLPISNYAAEAEVGVPPVEPRLVVPLPNEGIVGTSYVVVWNFTNNTIRDISNFSVGPEPAPPNSSFVTFTTFTTCTNYLASGETCQWAGTFIARAEAVYTVRIAVGYLVSRGSFPATIKISAGE